MLRIDEALKIEVYLIDSNETPGGVGGPGPHPSLPPW
jgi:hypothetical protein